MPRRDAFSMLRSTQAEPDASNANISPEVNENPSGIRPLDFIPAAEPRKRRERGWERTRRAEIATYRGIPPETHQTLIRIASALGVPVDEVARAFLEYGLGQYQAGQLPLSPYPKAQRMTLFPEGNQTHVATASRWLQQAFLAKQSHHKGKKAKSPKNWESRATYRIPAELKTEVKQVASEHFVGVGELVLFLFLYALKAFEEQRLQLQPQPKLTGKTLFKDRE
ncbi:hypothetical protein LARV_00920 [Longilinea arvoryzae]|uniref:HTH cro/C1-type domain-containing protein n=1 Tax=Longilinea arvoryzae TaxID=360412 RepID=A0A0S7BH58_9CHLR|nr:hypothetical protein [Longilinea arvoryzae]GAP13169.1 hypothetical protein LARV_00920 [Longilinea arvoryzae]